MSDPDINHQVVLARRPQGEPVLSDFWAAHSPRPTIRDGELLLRTIYVSIDPAMRGWLAETQGYVETVAVGAVMRSFGLGEVVASRHPDYQVGDLLVAVTGWQEWSAVDPAGVLHRVARSDVALSASLGVLGITGLTAYVGIVDIGRARAGETVLVSSAAGSVGSAAGQIARAQGARTIGMTGSEEKRRLCLDTFGFDACINYREVDDLTEALKELCPDGIDVYLDSVGGATLDAVLPVLAQNGRIAICGTISEPSGAASPGPRPNRQILVKRLTMQGFLATDYLARLPEISDLLTTMIQDGKLMHLEEITEGLHAAPQALEQLLAGKNQGKSIVRVGPETT
jgi:NADPH-dependent curcumin reductase CurA